ncbi:MAG: 30S ribosomal protein S18 [Patescibacteria group bacterium]
MAQKNRHTKRRIMPAVRTECYFCVGKKEPDYKEYKNLEKFVTERAKIVGARRSGVCSKHQRRLTVATKRARHLGLLPFSPKI